MASKGMVREEETEREAVSPLAGTEVSGGPAGEVLQLEGVFQGAPLPT